MFIWMIERITVICYVSYVVIDKQIGDTVIYTCTMYSTSREFRNKASKATLPFDGSNPSRFAKIPPGTYGTEGVKIVVNPDGSILIPPDAYADDVVAFVASTINGHGGIDSSIKEHLHKFVNDMDERAVNIHGYSGNVKERDYVWQ